MNRIWLDARNQPGIPPKWTYDQGVVLKGIEQVWYATGNGKYFRHIQKGMDHWIDDKGNHKDYQLDEYNIDHVTPGRAMLTLYRVTGNEKYKKIADLLRSQLRTQPRTKEGGFWHKKIYPNQMWLDGLYMGEPFYAEYSMLTGEDNWNDIANQFVWMETHARDPKTGLLYHGWDESKQQRWADKTTGRSPNFWGRAMGWYAMALVDTLDYFPTDDPRRAELIAILNREAAAIESVQDKKTGVWWQVLDKPGEKGNYLEASAGAMFVYALAKGVRLGYLPSKYIRVAAKGWEGTRKQFIRSNADGTADLEGTVAVSGLGGTPYRDGSYEYYIGEKTRTNDPKGLGAAIQAAVEIEKAETLYSGRGKTVLLDDFFNHEVKKDKSGRDTVWHYKWNEMSDSGFYTWVKIFESYAAQTATLSAAPTAANLKDADIYIIVDPDTDKESPSPNYIQPEHTIAIAGWVKNGGVLVLMGNDAGNAELDHFSGLSGAFGIKFNNDSKFRVLNNDFKMGAVVPGPADPILRTAKKIYVKEISTLSVKPPARAVLTANGDTIIAISKYGKGTVFVIGDPWLYNEYVDGRKLPAEYENFIAAQDLTKWLIGQIRK